MANPESVSCHISCSSFIRHFMSHKFCLPFMKLYLKMGSCYSHYSISIILLEEQREEYEDVICSDSFKDHITSLRYGLHLLNKFSYTTDNEDFEMLIRNVLYDVSLELLSLSGRPIDGSLIQDLDRAYTNLRGKMYNVIVNPETREYDVNSLLNGQTRDTYRFILWDFDELSEYRADAIAPLMKEIKELKEKLMLLQPLVGYALRVRYTEKYKELVAFVYKAACLIYSYEVDKMDEETTLAMKHKLTHLIENCNVKEIYIETLTTPDLYKVTNHPLGKEFLILDNLMVLLDINARIHPNDPGEKLRDKLKFLETFIANLPRELQLEKFHYFVRSIEEITRKAVPILCSFRDKDMKEEMGRELNDALSEVIDQIEDIQAEVQVIKLYNYPKTDGLGFLDFFLEHLEEMLKFQPEVIEIMKSQIETLLVEFDFLRTFLRNMKEQHDENEEIRDLWVRIIGLAYQVEYIIDFYLVKGAPDSRIMFSLTKVIEQTKLIKSEATTIYGEEKYHTQAQNVAKISRCVTSQATDMATNEVVGFADEAEKIREFLIGDVKQRDVVSIVGLPGLGKTTLARKLYEDPSLIRDFDVRAWCTVSQTYRTRDLLITIIGDIIGSTEEINKMDDEDLAAKLYRSLKGRRYLIVIDDLWHVKAWNSLARSLPNDDNHSRILVTSRLVNVASQTKVGSEVHFLREFSDDESWELFRKKLRQKESLSQEILEVGKQIVESCKRLPLAIVVIASLLEKVEKSVDRWKKIAANLSSHIFSDSESQCRAIIELSYNHLPDHLKSCFLYFGAFAEDEEIPLCKLKWLWIAEGFVRNTKTKNLEDVAEEYCLDLISRSLMTSTKERSCGGVKACRVHDLLRDFCLGKAKEDSFLQVIHINRESELSRVYDQHRLIIFSNFVYGRNATPFSCIVRSLLRRTSSKSSEGSYLFQNFKLLKVLDLGGTDIGNYFSKIELLIHLRYLAVTASITSIPSSISNLWNLQTLLVEANGYFDSEMVDVPDSLWDMVNLRHVHINYRASFEVHANRLESSILLNNLETLSTPWFSCKADAENLLRRLPKLQKLRCVFNSCWDDYSHRHQFPVLNFLDQLMSLNLSFHNVRTSEVIELNFPSNLRKLTLSFFPTKWNEISKIGRTLPNLEVLKLYIGSYSSETWFVDDEDFPKLKYLKLSSPYHFREWFPSEDSFPILKQLVLEDCWSLNEIPPCFGGIPTLQMITVKDCNSSVDDSARRIQKEQQEEWSNELKVYIYPRKQ